MIKVNLLGAEAVTTASGKNWVIGYAASLFVLVCCFIFIQRDALQSTEMLRMQAQDLQGKLDALKGKTDEVKALKSKRDLLNQKLAVIARLKKSKMGPVQLMDDINKALPEGLWLYEIDEKSDGMRIKGRALGDQEIVIFIENLKHSRYVNSIDLIETKQMYYAKRTGKVQAEPDIHKLSAGNRQTKDDSMQPGAQGGQLWGVKPGSRGKWAVVGGSSQTKSRDKSIDEFNIKIKEFVVRVEVNYAGKLQHPEPLEEREGV